MKNHLLLLLLTTLSVQAVCRTLPVGSNQTFRTVRAAAQQANPGDTILVFPGTYVQSEFIENLRGNPHAPIYILSAVLHGAIFQGNSQAWHLVDPQYLHIDGFVFTGQTGNGVNIDDGGSYQSPAKRIVISRCIFRDMNATGNNDLLKLSGLDSFTVKECRFLNGSRSTSGSGVDMVGCHHGLFLDNHFENMGGNAIQAKGGSQFIHIERCFFKNAGERAINIGGSTGLEFFRPINAPFEAADIEVYSNIFIGSTTAVAFVGCVRSKVINNTIVNPVNWIFRILQETVDTTRFLKCGDNDFTNNIAYFNNSLRTTVNVGPNTAPTTFRIENNLWFNHQNPSFNQISLPVAELNGIRAMDPQFENPAMENFRLKRNSPAIGKGKNTPKPLTDYVRKAFAAARSIGAFEFEGTVNAHQPSEASSSIEVFPNPSTGFFSAYFHNQYKKVIAQVYNMHRQKLWEDQYVHPVKITIDLSDLASGNYFCLFYDDNMHLLSQNQLRIIK